MKDYFLYTDKSGDPQEHQEIELEVQDMTTLEKIRIKAIISCSHADLSGADSLWLRDEKAYRNTRPDNPWAIKILQEIEEEADEVQVKPRISVPLRQKKGNLLKTLIEERTKDQK